MYRIEKGPSAERASLWQEVIYMRENALIKNFFGRELPIEKLPEHITQEQLKQWEELGMGIHYLPDIELDRKQDFPGWKIKPYEWFYERVALNDILDFDANKQLVPVKNPLNLGGRWVLIDERPKPADNNGEVYPQDFLEHTMKDFREKHLLDHNSDLHPGTRFFTSWTEWYDTIRPEVAKTLNVPVEQVRLPRVIEYNYLGNLLHPEWGKTDTWEWLQEACGGGKYRMRGGHSFNGGLAIVYWRGPAGHGTDRGFRPFVDLGVSHEKN